MNITYEFWCTLHHRGLVGRPIFTAQTGHRTVGDQTRDVYWEIDLSEMSCSMFTEDDDCQSFWQITQRQTSS
jgi:hypothetical protein